MKKIQKAFLLAFLGAVLFIASPIHAQTVVVVTPTAVVTVIPTPTPCISPADGTGGKCIQVDQKQLGFEIPTLSRILTFTLRLFFIIGGLAALVMLLLGAFSWITSGGEKEKVHAAQQKIQAAVLGLIMIVVVLAIVVTLEQVVFAGKMCLGLSCPITLPALLRGPGGAEPVNGSFQLLDESTPTPAPAQKVIQEVVTVTPTPSALNNSGNQLQTQPNSTAPTYSNGSVQIPQVPNSGMAQ